MPFSSSHFCAFWQVVHLGEQIKVMVHAPVLFNNFITLRIHRLMLKIFQPIFVAEALNAANYNTAPAVLKTFPVKYWCIDHLLRSFKIAPTISQ